MVIRREGHGFASDPHSCPSEPGYLDLVQCPAFQALQRVAVHIWIYSHICNQSEAFSKQQRDFRPRSFSGKGQRSSANQSTDSFSTGPLQSSENPFHWIEVVVSLPPSPTPQPEHLPPHPVCPAPTFLRPFLVLCVVDDVAQQEASRVLFRDGRPPQDRRLLIVAADVGGSADGG